MLPWQPLQQVSSNDAAVRLTSKMMLADGTPLACIAVLVAPVLISPPTPTGLSLQSPPGRPTIPRCWQIAENQSKCLTDMISTCPLAAVAICCNNTRLLDVSDLQNVKHGPSNSFVLLCECARHQVMPCQDCPVAGCFVHYEFAQLAMFVMVQRHLLYRQGYPS